MLCLEMSIETYRDLRNQILKCRHDNLETAFLNGSIVIQSRVLNYEHLAQNVIYPFVFSLESKSNSNICEELSMITGSLNDVISNKTFFIEERISLGIV